ncbi:MAG: hypothetical protein KJ963_06970, partial [Bacteroidetes bacterium]|nr:hypothetical protein [Bacteroidota bacterium]
MEKNQTFNNPCFLTISLLTDVTHGDDLFLKILSTNIEIRNKFQIRILKIQKKWCFEAVLDFGNSNLFRISD